ncbi:MAG TPA: beta-ketoacyl-[acyl-carrier-protein] synthase family protein [Burkholderiales bacterium]|nr:beta-ketoacyl-[acyl-carrier-protein] synthase family protein [Burkholderiales bacterium]
MQPLLVTHFAAANPLGLGAAATLKALREARTGLRPNDFEYAEIDTWIGRVDGLERQPVVTELAGFDCRNNRLAQLGLRQDGFEPAVAQARKNYGAERIAVLIGTSTSGILETELAYRKRSPANGTLPADLNYQGSHNLFSVADFVRRYLHLQGPSEVISTACSSSAKVFASAYRFIEAGWCDAAVVGGVDSLCLTTLHGFASLELLSDQPCRPCDAARNGISIGEAAGFALLERHGEANIALLGYGESSDAYHMSTPHPQGEGARLSMHKALDCAGLTSEEIDCINLHGTATPANDSVEDQAVCQLFGDNTPCSSTKGWTGHTLGAAGITEAIISILCIEHGFIPGTLNLESPDPQLKSRIVKRNENRTLKRVLSNSFGFGGNNCSLVFGRIA